MTRLMAGHINLLLSQNDYAELNFFKNGSRCIHKLFTFACNNAAMHPLINLWIEDCELQMPTHLSEVVLPGPGRIATLVVHIRGARGWIIEVLRNGMTEATETPRFIRTDEYCTTFQRIVHTACTIQVRCASSDGRSVLSDRIRVMLQSGVAVPPDDTAFAEIKSEIHEPETDRH